MLVTPEGRIARYFFGVEFAPRDLRLALVEASDERIGTLVDALLLFCFHYDPATGRYSRLALDAVRAGGAPDARSRSSPRSAGGCGRDAPSGGPSHDERSRSCPSRRRRSRRRSTRSSTSCSCVSFFFAFLIAGLIVVLHGRLPPPSGRATTIRTRTARSALEGALDGHPVRDRHGHLLLGRVSLYATIRRPPDDALADQRRRQAVDVEAPAPGGPARDQRAARADRTAGEADDDVRGRDPQLLRARVPHQAGRRARAATRPRGSRRRSRAATTSSAPSTAARCTRG